MNKVDVSQTIRGNGFIPSSPPLVNSHKDSAKTTGIFREAHSENDGANSRVDLQTTRHPLLTERGIRALWFSTLCAIPAAMFPRTPLFTHITFTISCIGVLHLIGTAVYLKMGSAGDSRLMAQFNEHLNKREFEEAIATADLMAISENSNLALRAVIERSEDLEVKKSAARKITNSFIRDHNYQSIVEKQLSIGDCKGALEAAKSIENVFIKEAAYQQIAYAQLHNDDIKGASETAEKLNWSSSLYQSIVEKQLSIGDCKGALETARKISRYGSIRLLA